MFTVEEGRCRHVEDTTLQRYTLRTAVNGIGQIAEAGQGNDNGKSGQGHE